MPVEITRVRYTVRHKVCGASVLVYVWDTTNARAVIDFNPLPWVKVTSPTWFGRITGVTFDKKIQKAVNKMQGIAEMYNAEEAVRLIKSKEASEAYLKAFVGERDV